MSDTIYPYVREDLLQKPNHYMYSPYHGALFLSEWRRLRTEFQARLVASCEETARTSRISAALELQPDPSSTDSDCDFSTQFELIERAERGDAVPTTELLQALVDVHALAWTSSPIARLATDSLTELYRRRFESTRILKNPFTRKLTAGPTVRCELPTSYVFLALLFSFVYRADPLRGLNALLKANDTLGSFAPSLFTAEERTLVVMSLRVESFAVEHLADALGVSCQT